MKQINRFAAVGSMLTFLFFTSCRKQIEEPIAKEATSQLSTIATTSCKPATFGVYQNYKGTWTTIAQKWYSNGKVRYFKGNLSGRIISLYYTEPTLNIDWGEVTYEGDQVRLRDVGKNRLVFRATLDSWGKPVASYLYNYTDNANGAYMIDTSYYYYTGDRLNYLIQLYETQPYSPNVVKGWEQYTFSYGGDGNLNSYYAKNDEAQTSFKYLSTPVGGAVTDYIGTTSFRMLQFLELIQVSMHNPIVEVNMVRYHEHIVPFMFFQVNFYNFAISDGLLQSYLYPFYTDYQIFYIGWDCGGSSSIAVAKSQNNIITNLDQFKKLYPAARK